MDHRTKHTTQKLQNSQKVNTEKQLDDFGYGNDFLDTLPQTQFIQKY